MKSSTASIRDWLRSLRRQTAGHGGQSTLTMVLSMTAMLAMLALVMDGGYAYAQRRQAQNAADAGVLAGLRTYWLSGNQGGAQATACDYATRNQATGCIAEFIGVTTLRIRTSRVFDTFFAGLIGFPTLTAHGEAVADVRRLVPDGVLWPVAVPDQSYILCFPYDPCGSPNCPQYEIWNSQKEAAGNAGWLDWDAGNHPTGELASRLVNPALSGHHEIGEWINGDPGLSNSEGVREAIERRQCQHVTVLVYDQMTGTGSETYYHIINFAEFVVTAFDLNGNNKWIRGQFVRWTEPGHTYGGPCTTGLCAMRLVQ